MANLNALESMYRQRLSVLANATNLLDIEAVIRTVQEEIDSHRFSNFFEPGLRDPITGCVHCRLSAPNYSLFIQHLRNDVLSDAIRKAIGSQPLS